MKCVRKGIWLSAAAFVGAVSLLPTSAARAESEIEEIIVTGSFIKRSRFDSASPLHVIDAAEIEAVATPSLGEILANQTFNYGSDVYSNNFTARFQEGNSTSANLRGLGTNATLQLFDGKRVLNSNLNNFIPQIAIQRIDILKDGAGALYGSDAVAGVVNIIPKKNFVGAEFSIFTTQDSKNDHNEQVYSALFGGETQDGDGHFAFAVEFRERTTLEQTDRKRFLRKGFSRSGTGNPGSWVVPDRDATGAITGVSQQRDPGCGVAASPGGTDTAIKGNNISGTPQGDTCRFQFGEFFNFVNPVDQLSFWTNYQYSFNDKLEFEADFTFSRQETEDRGSPSNPGGAIGALPTVLGEFPGNPFRALADSDGDGVLEPIFALDADGDGIADRDAAGVVLLPADPFDSTQGIPFNEDVDVAALRLFGKLGTLPTSLNSDGSNIGAGQFESISARFNASLTYTFDNDWEVMGSVIFHRVDTTVDEKNASLNAVLLGFDGKLGENRDEFFNPFSTVGLTCVDRICSDTGASHPNSQFLVDSIDVQDEVENDTTLKVVDIIATGTLIELPAGSLGAAFGFQFRDNEEDVKQPQGANRCDQWINTCGFDWEENQIVRAYFIELAIPLFDTDMFGYAEAQVANRWSDYGSLGNSSDVKVAFLWQPRNFITLRGSFSEAFIIPTLDQRFAASTSFLQTTNDPVFGDNEGSFRTNTFAGNPGLKPETADVTTFGVAFSFFGDRLGFGLDYSEFDFDDRISLTTAPQVIAIDFNNFLEMFPQADPLNPNPVDSKLWAENFQNPAISRVPNVHTIVEVGTEWLNAQTNKHKAYDAFITYSQPAGWAGNFDFRIDATYVDEFKFDLGNGFAGDGAGQQNDQISEIPPIPELRITATVNWNLGNHHVLLRGRFTDEVEFDAAGFTFAGCGNIPGIGECEIDSIVYVDLSYSYRFENLIGDRTTRIEIGGRNILDELPDPLFNLSGIETFINDPRGAMWYLRLNQEI